MTEQPTDKINFDDDDDQAEAFDDAPEARQTPPRRRATSTGDTGTPSYLRELLALPGVGPEALAGVPIGTAWIKIESHNGAQKQMPLAFLAPEALDTLADFGFENHTTFEIRATQGGAVVRYFACVLDEIDDDQGDQAEGAAGADGKLIELMTRQQMQINALQARIEAGAADPLAGVEKSLALFERFGKIMARVIPPAMPAAGGSDLGMIIETVAKVAPIFMKGQAGAGAAEAPDLPPEPEE